MSPRPSTLTGATLIVLLEALGLAGVAVFYLVELAVATSDDRVRALVTAGLAVLAATGLGLVARGLLRARRWARAPALVTSLLVLPVAYDLVRGGRWYVGLPVAAVAVAVIVLLFAPATEAALED